MDEDNEEMMNAHKSFNNFKNVLIPEPMDRCQNFEHVDWFELIPIDDKHATY